MIDHLSFPGESTNWGASVVSARALSRVARRGLRLAWIAIDSIVATVLLR